MSMLAPVPMLEVNLFVLERDLEAVAAALAWAEMLHVEDVRPEDWTPSGDWAETAAMPA